MKYLIPLLTLLLISCSARTSTIKTDEDLKTINFMTANARYVTKIVDGNVTCYAHSKGGIHCFTEITK